MHQIEHEFVRRIVLRVDAQFSYPTENRILFRFAANRTPICTGNRICVDSPLPCNTYVHLVLMGYSEVYGYRQELSCSVAGFDLAARYSNLADEHVRALAVSDIL
jgi:hypothetical protein